MKPIITRLIILQLAAVQVSAQTTCSLDWLNNITPAAGSLNNTFIAASAAITSSWKTSNPSFGSFNSGRPNFGSFASTLLTSSRGGGFGAKTTITFSSPVDFYRLHIKDLRGDGLTNESQKIEAYLNHVAVNRVYSTANASLVNINTGTNTINGSTITTAANQGEVMIGFTGAVDSLIIKSSGTSDFIIIDLICPDGIQSVQLSGLQAAFQAPANVALQWKTYKETNNKGFEIQRSADGLQFVNLGFVSGKNNSLQEQQYRFTDFHPQPGNNYYRLLQKNFDNSYTISETVLLKINPAGTLFYNRSKKEIQLWNNPVNVNCYLYNPMGSLIAKRENISGNTVIPVHGCSTGIYFLKIVQANRTRSFRLFIEK